MEKQDGALRWSCCGRLQVTIRLNLQNWRAIWLGQCSQSRSRKGGRARTRTPKTTASSLGAAALVIAVSALQSKRRKQPVAFAASPALHQASPLPSTPSRCRHLQKFGRDPTAVSRRLFKDGPELGSQSWDPKAEFSGEVSVRVFPVIRAVASRASAGENPKSSISSLPDGECRSGSTMTIIASGRSPMAKSGRSGATVNR